MGTDKNIKLHIVTDIKFAGHQFVKILETKQVLINIMQRTPVVRYHKINTNNDEYADAQFIIPNPTPPYRAITLAIVLFTFGVLLLVVGCMLVTGHIDVKYADRTYPVIILGLILFIPGFYHVRIAFYAWMRYKGYSYNDIPNFD